MKRGHAPLSVIVGGITILALAGCTAASEYAPRAVNFPIPSQDVVELPEGSVDVAVEELPNIVARILDESGIPGAAVTVVRDEEVLLAEGFGVRRSGEDAEIDAETVFQIASMSKPIGATVVASQVTEGVVSWETPVVEHLEGFALADPWVTEHLTIGDLYAHRSGLPLAAGDDLEDIGYDREYIIDHLRMQPLDPFRITYNYANFGMTTGAEAVSVAAGVDWATLSEQALYEPLGMASTSSRYADFLEHENRAALHTRVGDGFEPLYERMPDAQSPAGGVTTNAVDLAKWMSMVIGQGTFSGDEIATPEALLPAISPQIVSGHPAFADMRAGNYGYGFNVGVQPSGRVTISHSGAFVLGAATNFVIVPELGLGIAAITNGGPVGAAEAIVAEFLDRVQFGDATRDWLADYGLALGHYHAPAGDLVDEEAPASPAPPRPLEEYAGSWSNAYFGAAVVEVAGDGLLARLGPDGSYELDLTHWDGDVFSFVPSGENAPEGSISSATFAIGAGGETMTLDFFDTNGLGTWTRSSPG
ncbi:serine hydrolase [Microbacterium lacus]|uniref:serine hydrolase n=1 Tax=Microbacterium lacus TaxID=415217 RepID=UPI003850F113